tara:strand:- start:3515 stop:4180 length:666 start_codon:yes stop_codon:yes gene_type:complete
MLILLMDKILAFSALVLLSPVFLLIIFLLKITGEGEVFFKQERMGKNKKSFFLIKFATMIKDSPLTGSVTVKDDPRILPFGKFLRYSKINELPQLINVLRGDLSLIGPRPQVEQTINFLPEDLKLKLTKITPGLSGLASIILRDEENVLSIVDNPLVFHKQVLTPYKAKLEIWFDRKKNLFDYFTLIILTILAVMFPKIKLYNFFYKDRPKAPPELEEIIN